MALTYRINRLIFTQNQIRYEMLNEEIMSTDEYRFNFRPSDAYIYAIFSPRVAFDGGSVMVWKDISSNVLKGSNSITDSRYIQEILMEHLCHLHHS